MKLSYSIKFHIMLPILARTFVLHEHDDCLLKAKKSSKSMTITLPRSENPALAFKKFIRIKCPPALWAPDCEGNSYFSNGSVCLMSMASESNCLWSLMVKCQWSLRLKSRPLDSKNMGLGMNKLTSTKCQMGRKI